MTTVRLKFRASSVEGREGTLYFQIIRHRMARQANTGYKLMPSEWDGRHSRIIIGRDTGTARKQILTSLQMSVDKDLMRFRAIIDHLDRTGADYTADRIVELYSSPAGKMGFVSFARQLIGELKAVGKRGTAENYSTAINSFMRFRGGYDPSFSEMDSRLMQQYEYYLRSEGVCPNSSSFYLRTLRAIYNRAVERELTGQNNPFRHVYTGVDKTVKRAVPLKVIRQIRDMDLSLSPAMSFARDMFLFSFYMRGMSFVDMAFLKKKDLQNGILTYRRRKTGQRLFIKWEKPMQEIIARYDTAGSPFLLPIIRNAAKDERLQYKNAVHMVNNKLRALGMKLGLEMPLTTYVARHAWASIARSKNIPIGIISEAMGHDSEHTTRIYLASLDTTMVDRANMMILKSL